MIENLTLTRAMVYRNKNTSHLNKSGTVSIPLSGLIKRFPFCKPSYSTFVHKKVSGDYYMAIPMGKKYMAWFTHYEGNNVCIFVEAEIDKRDNIFVFRTAFSRQCCFHNDLSHGTLFYGSFVDNRFFCVEDIYHYKGQSCVRKTPLEKLNILNNIFKNEIKQTDLTTTNVIFSLCLMNESFKLLLEDVKTLDYKIYSIKTLLFESPKSYVMKYIAQRRDLAIFRATAEINTDTYSLYDRNNKYVGLAYIPNYKTSVLMNSLFRYIKENVNLDAIEESEDEEDFENKNNPEYFVDLEKCVNMECEYNPYFKAWVPLKPVKNGVALTSIVL